jgi:putative ATPase
MNDLFDHAMKKSLATEVPLAARMRPRTLEKYVGQEHILGEGKYNLRTILFVDDVLEVQVILELV